MTIKKAEFSTEEKAQYARHFNLKNVGESGQLKLKQAKVLCIGAGGLGSPALLYLAAAGIGNLTIIDFDRVDISNLQRQVLFTTEDVGKNKAEAAKLRLSKLNPHINIIAISEKLSSDNALQLFDLQDIILDGSDNFPTRYLVNDACVLTGKPLVYGAISQFEGQVSVFNYSQKQGERGINYRDLFPEPPAPGTVLNCAEAGVLGVLPGIIGSLQATEVIKIILGVGEVAAGRLVVFDALDLSQHSFKLMKNPEVKIEKLIDYDFFCGIAVPEISWLEYFNTQKQYELIDVRNPSEYAKENIGGALFPLGELGKHINKFEKSQKFAVHCQSGKRSTEAVRILLDAGLDAVNIRGGLNAKAQRRKDIDT